MSQKNLDQLLNPSSVAVVGASDTPGSIGNTIIKNIINAGYSGELYPINPKRDTVMGLKAYPSLTAVGKPIDTAVVVTGINVVPQLIKDCGQAGIPSAIIISAGGKEAGEEGEKLEAEIARLAKENGVRLIGPNCMGLISSKVGYNATFCPETALPGKVAMISQSGAMLTVVLDEANTGKVGFSYLVSLGDMADVDFGDMINYLGNDPDVSCILLYVESITQHRKFMSAARAVSRVKPIIALKTGRSEAASRAAKSHTGALTGEDAVYDAAFERAGIVRVDTIHDLLGCAELMAKQPLPKGPNLCVLTTVGGPGVMAVEAMAELGFEPSPMSPATMAKIDEILPPYWCRNNPIDTMGGTNEALLRKIIDIVVEAPEFDAALIMTAPQSMFDPADWAKVVPDTLGDRKFPVFTVWLGGDFMAGSRKVFIDHGIPTYDSPDRAVRAWAYMVQYGRLMEMLEEVPPRLTAGLDVKTDKARALVQGVLDQGRDLLSEAESKELLASYGIPVSPTFKAATSQEACAAAEDMGFPVVLKLDSKDITHKSDAGGVKLNLGSKEQVEKAFGDIMAAAKEYDAKARVDGVTVQPMEKSDGVELILGAKKDADFGPVILFGLGGITAEVMKDSALGLPPMNRLLARRLMEETKVHTLLKGYRNLPAADMELLEETIVRLAHLVTDLPQIRELDINPLVTVNGKALGLDARVMVESVDQPEGAHLSISPYPNQYERRLTTSGGVDVFIRPIRPEDAPAHLDFFTAMSPETVYRRFLKPMTEMPEKLLARYTQIDYDREVALVAFPADHPETIIGAARIIQSLDGCEAEVSLVVADAWQKKGVGGKLHDLLVEIIKDRGVAKIWGRMSADNKVMIKMAKRLGQTLKPSDEKDRLIMEEIMSEPDRG